MGRLLLATGLTASFFIVHGIFILKSGNAGGVFARIGALSSRAPTVAGLYRRLYWAMLYLVPGCALFALLITIGIKHHLTVSIVMARLRAVCPFLCLTLFLIGYGLFALVDPKKAIGSARRHYPDIPDDEPWALWLMKLIGAGICLVGLIMLFLIVG